MGTAGKTPCSTGINFYSFIIIHAPTTDCLKRREGKYSFLDSGKRRNVRASIIIIIPVLFGYN